MENDTLAAIVDVEKEVRELQEAERTRAGEWLAQVRREAEEELARLLTEAVSTRWQAHIKEIAKLLSRDKKELKETLRGMHDEYQTLMAATLMRASANSAAGEAGQLYLANIVDHFWEGLEG